MIHKTISLQLTVKQINRLKSHYQDVIRHLEKGFPLKIKVLKGLESDLSAIVKQSKQWRAVLRDIHDSGENYCVHLLHPDNEILNMPWCMAVDHISGQPLGEISDLFLVKSIPGCFEGKDPGFPKAPAPLKILIMISSPEDTEWKHRLSYEEEEYAILKAFEPLMHKGAVEVDFTEDGSLEALERKLKTNKYHILHFSGHATFRDKDKTGYIQLEDPLSLKTRLVAAEDFANAVNCHPRHKVPLVMLSSCKTAQGSTEEGLRGITNHLLKVGVPIVISMGMAVNDYYAALFSAHFYKQLAEKQTVFSAFNAAIEHLRETEYNVLKNTPGSREIPLQWIIPNLYLSRDIEEVVDWNQPEETLSFFSQRYIFGQERILLEHEKDYRFIGRRKDKAEILGPFFEKVPILLKGQGGVGKTAMAEHLVQRLIAKESKTVPFIFDESTRSIKEILDRLQDFLIYQGHEHVIAIVNQYEKALDKFQYLLFQVKEAHQPVFVFDNLESFQESPGEDFSEAYSDIKEVIVYLCERQICHVILTCRYPVPVFKNLWDFDLNQVGLNDFWKKCIYMEVGYINMYLRERASFKRAQGFFAGSGLEFIEVVKLLHQTFGGNYRALEFFDRLVKEKDSNDGIINSLDSLEKFQESSKAITGEVKQQMGENLLFSQLIALLDWQQQGVLVLLSYLRVPVQVLALQLQVEGQEQKQDEPVDWSATLESLHRLTLIEVSMDPEIKSVYFYVTPLVKNLLADYEGKEAGYSFSHEYAGIYYYHIYHNIEKGLGSLEEAFYHFEESGNRKELQELGDQISRFYYEYSMYRSAFFYANRVYQLVGEGTKSSILNCLGLIYYNMYGDYDTALNIFQKTLMGFKESGDKAGESAVLSNISGIYKSRGEYDMALKYLKEDLEICRQIGDKAGEGVTLNNISQIHKSRGDYESTLYYLGQCLKIFQEIGDKKGAGTSLINISGIYSARGDYDTALKYLEQCLELSREVVDKLQEGVILNNIGHIYTVRGDYDAALKYLEQSLKIQQEIGNKSEEASTLNNMWVYFYAIGDYDTALRYQKQSLKIYQEIGNKEGEGSSLNNISLIYSNRGDLDTALKYLEQSLKIQQEIGNKEGEGKTLNNISQIYDAQGDYETALKYLEQSLKISREIQDKSAEGMNLNNIGQIYKTYGDYDTALKYLEQSLTIRRQIKDKSGVCNSLHNIAFIAKKKGDIEKFLEYENEAYRIAIEINDAMGIYHVGKLLGEVLLQGGMINEGIEMLSRSLKVGKAAGFPGMREIEKTLNSVAGY